MIRVRDARGLGAQEGAEVDLEGLDHVEEVVEAVEGTFAGLGHLDPGGGAADEVGQGAHGRVCAGCASSGVSGRRTRDLAWPCPLCLCCCSRRCEGFTQLALNKPITRCMTAAA